jgi:hypothetical protein
MSLKVGRKGRLYLCEEAGTNGANGGAYGGIQDASNGSNTLSAAANAVRHVDYKFNYDPYGRVNSSEKKTSPGQVVTFDRRAVASLETLSGLIRPSGTLNTVPEATEIFKAGFGSISNVTLSTTISDASPSATEFDLASVTGLVAGTSFISIVVSGRKYARLVTNIAGSTVTVAPALPSAPADGAVVKAGISYKLTTDLSISLAALYCLSSYRREHRGIGIDKLSFTLDANAEPMFNASGPAQKELSDAAAVADPSTFTVVGSQNPPSGIVGDVLIADTSYLTKKIVFELTNGLRARNEEYGSDTDSGHASEVYRDGRRSVSVTLDAWAETAATLQAFAKAGTVKGLFVQTGRTEGNIIALYAPRVDWKMPDTDSPDTAVNWSFKGTGLESADEANDELYLALL